MAIGEWGDASSTEFAILPMPRRQACFVVRKGHRLAQQAEVTMRDLAGYPNVGPRLPAGRLGPIPDKSEMGRTSEDGRFFLPKIECSQLQTMLEVVAGTDAFCATFPKIVAPVIAAGTSSSCQYGQIG